MANNGIYNNPGACRTCAGSGWRWTNDGHGRQVEEACPACLVRGRHPERKPVSQLGGSLREVVAAYLRGCDEWREHPEHADTYMQWEDLCAEEGDVRTLPTDLAAVRQMANEGLRHA